MGQWKFLLIQQNIFLGVWNISIYNTILSILFFMESRNVFRVFYVYTNVGSYRKKFWCFYKILVIYKRRIIYCTLLPISSTKRWNITVVFIKQTVILIKHIFLVVFITNLIGFVFRFYKTIFIYHLYFWRSLESCGQSLRSWLNS